MKMSFSSPLLLLLLPILFCLLAIGVAPCCGYNSGAPNSACGDRVPQHGANPQTSASPFSISFSPNTFTPGETTAVNVTLSTRSGATFQGFLLSVQYEGGDPSDSSGNPGTFTALPSLTALACSGTAVTHSTRNNKNSLIFQWVPPSTRGGNVRFRATFVRSYLTFWVDVEADRLLMENSLSVTTASPVPEPSASQPQQPPIPTIPTPTPATTTSTPTTPTPSGKVVKDADCGSSKGCFSDCQDGACSFLVTWSAGQIPDTVRMSLSGTVDQGTGRYIALGLSEDQKMGSDSVMHCINQPNGVFFSYNVDVGKDNTFISNPQDGLSDVEVSYADNVLTCSFTRVRAADNTGQRFALDTDYTLLYATGPENNGLQYHSTVKPKVSGQKASLVDFSADMGGSKIENLFIRAHGSLMIVAWIFAASIGIILARYFKTSWQDSTWCGQKVWFQLHRSCMVIAVLATVTAFIIIFVEVGGYSDIAGKTYHKAHPILGIIVTALTVLNPVMALCRPHPGTPRRPVFNWAHWLVGSGAHILGVITIFFGTLLANSGAPQYIIYILAAYVGWQVLIQILLEITQCLGRNKGHSESYEMSSVDQMESSKAAPTEQAAFSKEMLLFLHILVITGFTIALIVILVIGEEDS